MKALILAAGYATRLYPLTKEYPKPLLLVKDKPIINYIIDKLEGISQVDEIIVVTNSKFISHFRKWAKGLKLKKRLSLVDDLTKTEADKRGAIGDIDFVLSKKRIKDDLLIIGGDNLFDAGLDKFVSFIQKVSCAAVVGVYDLGSRENAHKYGIVKINKENLVTGFQEKPDKPESTLVAMCLYWFAKDSLVFLRQYLSSGVHKADATGFYIDWLSRNTKVYAFNFSGKWYDIGDHEFYDRAKKQFKKREAFL